MSKEWHEMDIFDWVELILFDFTSGKAWWKERDAKWFEDGKQKAKDACSRWNARTAGKELISVGKSGYKSFCLNGKRILLHRLIWFVYYGYWPEYIDHINGDKLDNRIENLREVTKQENMLNMKKPRSNTSGVVGVCFVNREKKWRAQIKFRKQAIYLGLFENFEDAVAARKAAEIEYGFHPNHGMR